MLDTLLLLAAPISLILISWRYVKHRQRERILRKNAETRRVEEQDLVPCFTCGIKIPREGALEKKGRYFCGIKKETRENTTSV